MVVDVRGGGRQHPRPPPAASAAGATTRPPLPHLLLALLLLAAAAALPRPCSAQQDDPLKGFGLSPPNATTRVWVSVFLDRLLNVNGDDYEFTVSGWPRALPDSICNPLHRSPSGPHAPFIAPVLAGPP
jgi:hypothetical protein